ncbi:hypothetical protein OH76DRAFT_1198233 [Lentinus brumalis]|uniref:Uncharacterized protein n=1 Tax=Lentinus brumalis TaxID=2498619 RepID=A0A371CTC6_9APHY|nr:hypothetical protein OH76DRAFT_1198233 [Polyporus brumalis]
MSLNSLCGSLTSTILISRILSSQLGDACCLDVFNGSPAQQGVRTLDVRNDARHHNDSRNKAVRCRRRASYMTAQG